MSIQSEINRIAGNVSDALDAIGAKGVTVPASANSDNLATLIATIPSGGAQVAVHGTFKYTAEGWYTISLPYTGNGWPVAAIVSPKGGRTNNPIVSAVRRYAIVDLMLLLLDYTTQPLFDGDACRYSYASKTSASDAAAMGASTGASSMYRTTTSTSNSVNNAFRVSGNREIKVRMVDTTHYTSRYGFLVGYEYDYYVLYSS